MSLAEKIIEKCVINPEAVIAFFALIISIVSVVFTFVTIIQTRKHNRLSVKPLCHIFPPDYEDRIAVIIQNKGIGPLITKSIKFYDSQNNIKKYLIDLMPALPKDIYWSDFTKNDRFVLSPGEGKTLIEFNGELSDQEFIKARDMIRHKLGDITLEYELTDIYESSFPKVVYKLDYFHRKK